MEDTKKLKKLTAQGGTLVVVAQVVQFAVTFLVTPILTRLLSPSDFGVVGMASALVGLGQMFTDAGLSSATIQKSDLTAKQSSNLFWTSSLIGLLFAGIAALLAGTIAGIYREPLVKNVVYLSAIGLAISGFQVQPLALLKRNLQFRALAGSQIASALVAAVVTIVVAYKTHSYLALAIGPIAGSALNTVLAIRLSKLTIHFPARRIGTKSLLSYGAERNWLQLRKLFLTEC